MSVCVWFFFFLFHTHTNVSGTDKKKIEQNVEEQPDYDYCSVNNMFACLCLSKYDLPER